MPIMALFRSPRLDRGQYDAIINELDLQRNPPVGAVTHACGFDDAGICVVDVWTTREDFERFVRERLSPAFARLGLPFEPPTVLDAYAFEANDAVDRYKPELAPA